MPIELYRGPNFNPTKPYKKADLHIQTTFSDGWAQPQDIVEAAQRRGLHTISITDHDQRAGFRVAVDHAKEQGYPLEILPGVEITTKHGHLLAHNVIEDIPRRLSMEYTLFLIHRMGGMATLPHPFLREMLGSSIGKNRLLRVLGNQHRQVYFDGFEIYNGGAAAIESSKANQMAQDFYLEHPEYSNKMGAPVGNSDTHRLEVGSVFTAYQGENIFEAMQKRQIAVFREDRVEGLDRINYSVDRLGSKTFEDLPSFILKRINKKDPKVKIYAVELPTASELVAAQFLTNSEMDRFRTQRDARKAAFLASRMALKLAYSTLTGDELEIVRALNIGNKVFGEHRSGPPFFEGGKDLYFSLAHSGNMGLGATSEAPVGVDVEQINHNRPPRTGLISDAEIVQESILNPDLDLYEIAQKLAGVKEAVAKGLTLGNSRRTSFDIVPLDTENYLVTASRNQTAMFPWRVKTVRRGDYFISVGVQSSVDVNPDINWVNSSNLATG